jgi:Pyridoxamine 5'-phosphate oxidase
MAKFYADLTDELQAFIAQQHLFFTATAPKEGRINLSPKGIDTFRVIDRQTVAYLDVTGSGNETSTHLAVDDRMTIMFCSFAEKPLIMRLYGTGKVIRPRDPQWNELSRLFPTVPGTRQIIQVLVQSAQTSCGMGVPIYDYVGERNSLIDWATKKGDDGLREYWEQKNQVSIDGLPTGLLEEGERIAQSSD